MKQDIFDQVQKNKKAGPQQRGKAPPDCPKSDKMTPFFGLAFADGEMYVKVNSTEGQCQRLISVGGANFSVLINASRTCGPAGEWKKRIAEELSAVFFQGGLEWVRSENETIEVITEEGTFEAVVNEEKYAEQADCWKRGCGCEQANNPKMRVVFITILVIMVGGLGFDSLKFAWEKVKGKKPSKHVECKKGHRMTEVKMAYSHHCDVCGAAGTTYQCGQGCNYDMCKKCYKEAKKKTKAAWKEWVEKHPEDKEKEKKDKSEKDDDDDEKESTKGETDAESKSEPESTKEGAASSGKAASEAEQDDEGKGEEAKSGEGAAAEGEREG